MARKPELHGLPPLQSLLPKWRGFGSAENQSQALLGHLRVLLRAVREKKARSFYTQRELAAFFGVPLRTVARAEKQLAAEGLMVCLRGSKTLVAGRAAHSRATIRGVVGLPIWLTGFKGSVEWSQFFTALEEELRRHRYVADFIFFQDRHEIGHQLLDRLLEHELDFVIMFSTDRPFFAQVPSIADHGIPVIVIGDGKIPRADHHYFIDYESAYRQIVSSWIAAGISHIAIAAHIPQESEQEFRRLEKALAQANLTATVLPADIKEPAELLRHLETSGAQALALLQQGVYQQLCSRDFAVMDRIFQSYCTVLLQGNIRNAYHDGLPTGASLVLPDYVALARRVAQDLHYGRALTQPSPVIIDAKWLQVERR